MERNKYIQWLVTADHLEDVPLGYRIDLSRDKSFSDLIFSRSTFSNTEEFSYDPSGLDAWTKWPAEGLDSPIEGTSVRFNYSHGHSTGFVTVSQSSLLSIKPDGSGIESSLELNSASTPSISVDSENGDFWIHDSGRDTILIINQSLKPVRSLVSDPFCIRIIRDGIWDSFWEVRGNNISVRNSGGKVLSTHSLPYFVTSVIDYHICRHTGDLFLVCDAISNKLFLHIKRRTGVYYSDLSDYSSVSYKGASSTYLASLSGQIYEYSEGSGLSLAFDLSYLGIHPYRLSTYLDMDFYILDNTTPEILKIEHSSGNILWRKPIDSSVHPSSYDFDVYFQALKEYRPIHFWADGYVGTILDFTKGPELTGLLITEEEPMTGSLKSFNRPSHIWAKISPATELDDGILINSSSSSSSSSSISSISSDSSDSSDSSSLSTLSSSSSPSSSSSSISSDSSNSSSSSSLSTLSSSSSPSSSSSSISSNSSDSSSSSSSSFTGDIIVYPSEDAYVDINDPNSNFGNEIYLRSYYNPSAGYNLRSYIVFPTSELDLYEDTILRVRSTGGSPSNVTVNISLAGDLLIDEDILTWNNKPASNGTFVTSIIDSGTPTIYNINLGNLSTYVTNNILTVLFTANSSSRAQGFYPKEYSFYSPRLLQ